MRITSLGYFGVNSAKIEEWRKYATDVMAVMVADHEGGLRLRVDNYLWRIAIEPAETEGLAYVGWEVANPAEFAVAKADIAAAGVEIFEADAATLAKRDVMDMFYCFDPDGVRTEIFYGAKESSDAFHSPHGTRFVTGDAGLGHVVYHTENFEKSYDFYTRIMKMRTSDFCDLAGGKIRLAFMNVNYRHHSLAFGGFVQEPRPERIFPPYGQLFHFMLETETLPMVGRAMDACMDGVARISESLGQHSNDQMISFYSLTPSGFPLEYGTGGLRVDDTRVATRMDRTSYWGHRKPPKPASA